jgi:hypothetical protein
MSVLTPIDATCLTCRWFVPERSDDAAARYPGTCRRHCPPWFDVDGSDFCGDWATDYAPVLRTRND